MYLTMLIYNECRHFHPSIVKRMHTNQRKASRMLGKLIDLHFFLMTILKKLGCYVKGKECNDLQTHILFTEEYIKDQMFKLGLVCDKY